MRQYAGIASFFTVLLATVSPVTAQSGTQMTGAQLSAVLSNGQTLTLGTPHTGDAGALTLREDGSGTGWVRFYDDRRIEFSGSWEVRGDQFCRTWTSLGDEALRTCEEWILRSPRSADVYEAGRKTGVNSW